MAALIESYGGREKAIDLGRTGSTPVPGQARNKLRNSNFLRRNLEMSRIATVAAAQMGPIEKDEPRQSTVARMISMMRQAKTNQEGRI